MYYKSWKYLARIRMWGEWVAGQRWSKQGAGVDSRLVQSTIPYFLTCRPPILPNLPVLPILLLIYIIVNVNLLFFLCLVAYIYLINICWLLDRLINANIAQLQYLVFEGILWVQVIKGIFYRWGGLRKYQCGPLDWLAN